MVAGEAAGEACSGWVWEARSERAASAACRAEEMPCAA
uniref:Uncharacterized protein n=1 Tax=Phage sp. ct4bw6 TaxID=2826747 RepID=A0A8S5MV21_9VIRU|nr:MAG TPA: hypothetical protein [Phage sp. ct4bw6]